MTTRIGDTRLSTQPRARSLTGCWAGYWVVVIAVAVGADTMIFPGVQGLAPADLRQHGVLEVEIAGTASEVGSSPAVRPRRAGKGYRKLGKGEKGKKGKGDAKADEPAAAPTDDATDKQPASVPITSVTAELRSGLAVPSIAIETAESDPDNADIVGGVAVEAGVFPWMARIHLVDVDGTGSSRCGAVLISDSVLLTAAHCFYSASRTLREIDFIR